MHRLVQSYFTRRAFGWFQAIDKNRFLNHISFVAKKEITSVALRLPPRSRARLAARLLDSLGASARRQLDRRWAAEAESRIDAFDAGQMKSTPVATILAYRGKAS